MVTRTIWRVSVVAGSLALAVVVTYLGFRVVRADLTAAVYRQKLTELAKEHEAVVEQYNRAVRRTAVTELVVRDGKVSVAIRTADGVVQSFDTSANPAREVYVDYAVLDGRLWIRRVFDAATPPERGTVIDPQIAEVNWDDAPAAQGQAVYRSLGEGRWVVSVSGDGALGLVRAPDDEPALLTHRPELGDFSEIQAQADREAKSITLADVLDLLFR